MSISLSASETLIFHPHLHFPMTNDDIFLKMLKKARDESDNISYISIKREQVNTNNPAIAKLIIKFPKNMSHNMELYYKNISFQIRNPDVEPVFRKLDEDEYEIEIKSSMYMYQWFESFIGNFREDFTDMGKEVRISGAWDRYGN